MTRKKSIIPFFTILLIILAFIFVPACADGNILRYLKDFNKELQSEEEKTFDYISGTTGVQIYEFPQNCTTLALDHPENTNGALSWRINFSNWDTYNRHSTVIQTVTADWGGTVPLYSGLISVRLYIPQALFENRENFVLRLQIFEDRDVNFQVEYNQLNSLSYGWNTISIHTNTLGFTNNTICMVCLSLNSDVDVSSLHPQTLYIDYIDLP